MSFNLDVLRHNAKFMDGWKKLANDADSKVFCVISTNKEGKVQFHSIEAIPNSTKIKYLKYCAEMLERAASTTKPLKPVA